MNIISAMAKSRVIVFDNKIVLISSRLCPEVMENRFIQKQKQIFLVSFYSLDGILERDEIELLLSVADLASLPSRET